MKLIEKEITGYATTYETAYQYSSSYPWANVANAFDWSPRVSPNDFTSGSWRETYASAKIYWSTSSSYQWYLSGIGTFKSCLNDNFDDAYDDTGKEYINFSCIPDNAELKRIAFMVRSSVPKYNTEAVKYYKNGVDVTYNSSNELKYLTMKSASSSAISVTENRVVSGTTYNQLGHIWEKINNIFYNVDYSTGVASTSNLRIGEWSISDFKNGLFKTLVRCKSNNSSASTNYWYPRGFAVKLTVDIPAYDIKVSSSAEKSGYVTGGGLYFQDKSVTVTATANKGYKFSHWMLNGENTGITDTTVTFPAVADYDIVAVFEQEACIMYDTIFSYKQWKENGITSSSCNIYDITDTGFTIKSNHSGNDGYTNESPKFHVEPNTKYVLDLDCEGTGWQVFVFFYIGESTSWSSHTNSSSESTIFETPDNCSYISIRIDANALNNIVKVSNIRIYPYGLDYMSTSVDVSQRTNLLSVNLPNRVIRHGFLFDGWNTELDGTGISYTKDSKFPEESVTLYSQWLLPILFKGKFAKYLHLNGITTDEMSMNGKVFPTNPIYLPVKFFNWNGDLIYTENVLFGHLPQYNGKPSKESTEYHTYKFIGWDKNFDIVKNKEYYTAQYEENIRYYTITFGYYDINNNFIILDTQSHVYLGNPVAPNAQRENDITDEASYKYDFTGWDSDVSSVTRDKVYIAQYNIIKITEHTVTWSIANETMTELVKHGEIPSVPVSYSPGSIVQSNGINYTILEWNNIEPVMKDTIFKPKMSCSITTRPTKYGAMHVPSESYTISGYDEFVAGTGELSTNYKGAAGEKSQIFLYGFDLSNIKNMDNIYIDDFNITISGYKYNYVDASAFTEVYYNIVSDFPASGSNISYSDCGDGMFTIFEGNTSATISHTKANRLNAFNWMNNNIKKVLNNDISPSFGILISFNYAYISYINITFNFIIGT